MTIIRSELPSDYAERDKLLDRSFGPGRLRKTSEKFRRGRLPAEGLAFIAEADGVLIGTLRLWSVDAGGHCPALLLGPLAVSAEFRNEKIGTRLMLTAIETARILGHKAILLVGDAPYYNRFGFSAKLTSALRLPGPYEKDRFLALELLPGALSSAQGLVVATGVLKNGKSSRVSEIANKARAA